MEFIYGTVALDSAHLTMLRIDRDMIFIKIVLALLLFSTFDSTDYQEKPPILLNDTAAVLRIQDRYIELAWRYLLYRYDHQGAVRCFSNLIQSLMALHRCIVALLQTPEYVDLLNRLIKRIEETLNI